MVTERADRPGCLVQHRRLADGNQVLALGHLPARRAVVALGLHEDDRIVAANGRGQQALGVRWVGWVDHLEPRGVDEDGFGRLRVVVPALDSAAGGHAYHHWRLVLAARAVAHLGQLVHDLVVGRVHVVGELDLGHRPQPVQRHPDGAAHDAVFRQRCVDATVRAEFFLQAHGGAKNAAKAAHVFAQHHDPAVPAHLDPKAVIHGLDDVHLGHGELRRNYASLRPESSPTRHHEGNLCFF